MANSVPAEITGQKYISLATFRKSGIEVRTPVWFGEADGRLYVRCRTDSGKFKRVRNNSQVKVAACTVGGKITGPDIPATARILPTPETEHARQAITRKYWLARLPWIWNRSKGYLEIAFQ